MDDSVRAMVFLIVEQLKAYVDGDEDALREPTQVLDSGSPDPDTLNQAFELIFARSSRTRGRLLRGPFDAAA